MNKKNYYWKFWNEASERNDKLLKTTILSLGKLSPCEVEIHKVDWSNWHIVKVHRDSSNDGKFVFTGRNVPLIEFFCLCLLPFFSRCKLLVIKPSCTLPESDVNFSKLLDLSALKCHEWKGRTKRCLVKIWIHEKRRYTKAQNTQELPVIQGNWWKGINWLRGWINLAALNVYKCKCICWTRT